MLIILTFEMFLLAFNTIALLGEATPGVIDVRYAVSDEPIEAPPITILVVEI
jgi:hypothetical protein